MTIFLQILFGVIAGFFGGMGMGGGTVLIPLLTIFLGFEQQLSQGINLLSFLVMAVVSLLIHTKNGLVVTKNIFWLILGGVIFAVIGSLLATILPSTILKKIFGAFLCVISITEIFKVMMKKKK